MSLYIGTNYHPHDWSEDRWITDIEMMKKAGFSTVRLGHLCWDSYEPDEGVYTFEWFDKVMDLFAEAGIGVVLDVSLRPAPVWVHKLCPECNITDKSGKRLNGLRRYMEDIGDPAYQGYALRFAKIMVKRYQFHPALFAFGLCNEIGDGYISYSEANRNRFVNWLKKKYGNVTLLNQAWATQRWSRRLNSFDEVWIPDSEPAVGAPEQWLDFRRFLSDEAGGLLSQLADVIEEQAPGIPHSSNHYAEKRTLGFDYLKYCDEITDYPGMGFYPGYDIEANKMYSYISSIYIQRLAETDKPMWCLEFQTGQKGIVCGPYGAIRMHVFLSLIYRAQMILGWTWRSMAAGEEQYLYGMLMHDGEPSPNYQEYCQIAADFKKLQEYDFPYLPQPDIGVAYHYDSAWAAGDTFQYRQSYEQNFAEAHSAFFSSNRDYNVVDLRNLKKNYKLIVIPGHVIIDSAVARTIRNFVADGGTVIMTGYSGIVDTNGQVFTIPRPGMLTDVFGIRVSGFYRTDLNYHWNEQSEFFEVDGKKREVLYAEARHHSCRIQADYYEQIELREAVSYSNFRDKQLCAVSVNNYGKGRAYYAAVESNSEFIEWLLGQLEDELGLQKSLPVPKGIQARKIADGQYFYVNTTDQSISIPLIKAGYGVLTGKHYETDVELPAYAGELIICDAD